MDFITFARAHGVVIGSLIEDGRWHRVPTIDKPHKRNGAYRFMGDHGHVQNWEGMTEADLWQADGDSKPTARDLEAIQARAREAAARIRQDQQRAADRASTILAACKLDAHPYLHAKGFPEERGLTYTDEEAGDVKLCIPMKVDGRVVGVQTISDFEAHERVNRRTGEVEPVPAFEKRFLYGQRLDLACHVIGSGSGPKVFVEGYATGLSVSRALEAMRARYTLFVCFTAGNLLKIARQFEGGVVIADNDRPSKQHPNPGGHGLYVAHELHALGHVHWASDREGEDANDFEKRRSTFALTMALKPLLMRRHRPEAAM